MKIWVDAQLPPTLATSLEGQVAASTQNQVLSALLFLYRDVLHQALEGKIDALRAKPSQYLPTVLTKEEVLAVIDNFSGIYWLLVQMLYDSGLHLIESLRLRVKDRDFAQQQIAVRDAKGAESRVTMLPARALKQAVRTAKIEK